MSLRPWKSIFEKYGVRVRLMVNVVDLRLMCNEFEPDVVADPPCCAREICRGSKSSRWCGERFTLRRSIAHSGALYVVPARISSQSSRHCWRSPLPYASALIQRDFGCVLGSRPSSFHTLPKLIWCGCWGCNQGQSLSNHGPRVFYRRKIRRASRPGKQFNLVIDEEPLDNACHVWLRIILLKYGCGEALKVRKDNCLQHLGDVARCFFLKYRQCVLEECESDIQYRPIP
ncbi:uncharacterized protein TNCV_3950771 [Trichonephila clavipes]|nr:uncharacterized protein TNCV_3950771 [Trichonephila clavipes]